MFNMSIHNFNRLYMADNKEKYSRSLQLKKKSRKLFKNAVCVEKMLKIVENISTICARVEFSFKKSCFSAIITVFLNGWFFCDEREREAHKEKTDGKTRSHLSCFHLTRITLNCFLPAGCRGNWPASLLEVRPQLGVQMIELTLTFPLPAITFLWLSFINMLCTVW